MPKSPLLRTLTIQVLVLLPLALAIFVGSGRLATVSFLIGAAIYALPNLLFTLYAFRYRGATHIADIYRSIKFGELVKLVLTTIGFALVFKNLQPINELALLSGFVVMLVLQPYIVSKHISKLV